MYCVKLFRNGKKLDEQFFNDPETMLKNAQIMMLAAALSCDDIPNLVIELFECKISKVND